MNFLLVRLFVWLFTLAFSPIPLAVWPQSFAVEVLERFDDSLRADSSVLATNPAALPPGERTLADQSHEWTERILVSLERAEKKEIDPWLRDDYRIAWITAKWSQYGIPEWAWLRESPYVAATYQVLHCRPDEVWPRIVAQRHKKLGQLYEQVWGEGLAVPSSPRKPVQSVKSIAALRKRPGGRSSFLRA